MTLLRHYPACAIDIIEVTLYSNHGRQSHPHQDSQDPYQVPNCAIDIMEVISSPKTYMWVCVYMRVVPLDRPWKGHQPLLLVFDFLILLLNIWKTSKFWAASCKNESNLLLHRILVCIESCLPVAWLTFIWWKNLPKCCSILVWIAGCWNSLLTSRNPKNNWCLPHFWSTV